MKKKYQTQTQVDLPIELFGENIDVKLTLSRRRTKVIIIRQNAQVEVKAPLRTSVDNVVKLLKTKEDWIVKQRKKMQSLACSNPAKLYQEGEYFGYLGQKYCLKTLQNKIPSVKIEDGFLCVAVKNITPAAVRTALKFWYLNTAKQVFQQRMPACLQMVEFLKLPQFERLDVRLMKRKWGSCASNGVITLNPELVAAPPQAIDYVIIHELCHLRQHNHSPKFYKLLDAAMPNWRVQKELLNKTTEIRFL